MSAAVLEDDIEKSKLLKVKSELFWKKAGKVGEKKGNKKRKMEKGEGGGYWKMSLMGYEAFPSEEQTSIYYRTQERQREKEEEKNRQPFPGKSKRGKNK